MTRQVERAIIREGISVRGIGVEMSEARKYKYRAQRGKPVNFEVKPPSVFDEKYIQVDIPPHGSVLTVHDSTTYTHDLSQQGDLLGYGDYLSLEPKLNYGVRRALVRLGIGRRTLTDDQMEEDK